MWLALRISRLVRLLKGTVHNVVDFGAFIDFGLKTNGLLHRSELCTAKQHPSDVYLL